MPQKGNNSLKKFIKFQNSKINKKNNKVQNFQKISILQNFLKKKSKFSKDIKFFKKISTFQNFKKVSKISVFIKFQNFNI